MLARPRRSRVVTRVPERMETERLLLRTWRRDDLEAFAALNGDERVMRFVGARRPLAREESERLLGQIVGHWERHGFGLWAVQPRGDAAEPIGFVGLAVPAFLPSVLPAVEVGWRLAPGWWGHGLATEGARASVAAAWEALGLRCLLSIIHPDNERSLRVAAKLGMRPGRDRLLPGSNARVRVLELDAELDGAPEGALDAVPAPAGRPPSPG
jgi:RimJ/RimL family protein N-acetyltransferase